MLARQSAAGLTNFQRVATDLLLAHPGLASIELQPGGVVSDVVPRAGHERVIGFNVLKDPVQRAEANEAIARRALTLSGPVQMDHGEQGLVARVPIFQRISVGRDSFWGFVALSMQFKQVLARAQVDELWRNGYSYAVVMASASQPKGRILASRGILRLDDAVQQPIQIQNVGFVLALKPRAGWIDKTQLTVQSVAVLLVSVLVGLLVTLLGNQHRIEAALAGSEQQRASGAVETERAREDCRAAKKRVDTLVADLKVAQLSLAEAQSNAERLQSKLDSSQAARDQTIKSHQAELRKVQDTLMGAMQEIAELKTRLDASNQTEIKASATAQERFLKDANEISDLKARLQSVERTGREAARASAAQVDELERSKRDLQAQLAAAAKSESRIRELESLLQAAREELNQGKKPATSAVSVSSSPTADTASQLLPDARKADSESTADPAATTQAPAPKSRKARQDRQLHLFGAQGSAVTAPNTPATPSEFVVAKGNQQKAQTPETLEKSKTAFEESASREPAPKAQFETKGKKAEPDGQNFRYSTPPIDPVRFRKACHQIAPLLSEHDPGAKDCLRDNRKTFRSAFTPEAYPEFEQMVNDGHFDAALDQLKKAARKNDISI